MSEYQYYEFIAVDRPLTDTQQRELRAVSTRARITSSSFVNEYEWGDLKGDPRTWMEQYFDAFLYLANWGTRRIALRLPLGVLDAETAAEYCLGDSAHSWATRTHLILDLNTQDDERDEWWDDQDRLASIVPARAELAANDNRLLYLAWLLCVQAREVDDEEPEPPVPPGLGELSGPLRAVSDFLRLDPDLLAAAAVASPQLTAKAPSAAALSRWVKQLPEADKDAALLGLLRGDDAQVRAELLRRFHGPVTQHVAGGRTVGELLTAAEARWAERQHVVREKQTAEQRRQEQLAEAAREKRLDELAGRQAEAWQRVVAMIETRKPKEYDAAIVLLNDLRALAERDGDTAAFDRQMGQLRQDHIRKPSLIDRFDRAALS